MTDQRSQREDPVGRLAGKVAIVIGAGQTPGPSIGNGRATVLRFVQEGATVLAVDRDIDSAQATVDMAGASGSLAFAADVRERDSLQSAVDFALEQWGRIDILHYNVGISLAGGDGPLEVFTEESFALLMEINLRGAIVAAQLVEPIMRSQGSGVVINVASIAAVETETVNVSYRVSKAGMVAFTEQFAMRNAAYGVRANSILPGLMETAMAVETRAQILGVTREEVMAQRKTKIPLKNRVGTGWDTANAAVFLASEEAGFITGVSLPVDGGTLARIG